MVKGSGVQRIRDQLDEILERARNDEEFGQQLNTDPESTLRQAGLHPRAVDEVSDEIRRFNGGEGDEESYMSRVAPSKPQRACDFTTCWISWCNHWGTFRTS